MIDILRKENLYTEELYKVFVNNFKPISRLHLLLTNEWHIAIIPFHGKHVLVTFGQTYINKDMLVITYNYFTYLFPLDECLFYLDNRATLYDYCGELAHDSKKCDCPLCINDIISTLWRRFSLNK